MPLTSRWTLLLVLTVAVSPAQAGIVGNFASRCHALLARHGYVRSNEFYTHPLEPIDFETDHPYFQTQHHGYWFPWVKGKEGPAYNTYESHRVLYGKQEWLNKMIAALHVEGGEIRLLTQSGSFADVNATGLSFFYYDLEAHQPRLALARNAPPEDIAHDFQHFLDWKKRKRDFMNAGVSEQEAGDRALKFLVSSPMQIYVVEANAVVRSQQHRPVTTAFEVTYPEVRACYTWTSLLQSGDVKPRRKDDLQMDSLLQQAIWRAAEIRRRAIADRREKFVLSPARLLGPSESSLKDFSTLGRDLGIDGTYRILDERFQRVLAGEATRLREFFETH